MKLCYILILIFSTFVNFSSNSIWDLQEISFCNNSVDFHHASADEHKQENHCHCHFGHAHFAVVYFVEDYVLLRIGQNNLGYPLFKNGHTQHYYPNVIRPPIG